MSRQCEHRQEPRFRIGEKWHDQTIESVDVVGSAIADVAVRPTLLKHGETLVVAYYDASRRLTLADRKIGASSWNFQRVDSGIGWDSHNYIDLGFDQSGRLHIAGNMHASPLQYWIAELNVGSRMTHRVETLREPGKEQRVTYPRFLRDNDGRLLFTYRDGVPGDGDFVCLRWDEAADRYESLTDHPLIEGRGSRNAYIDTNAPVLGPDGRWHMLWVWRGSPEAESTHTVNYARSADLVEWTTAAGTPLANPLGDDAGTVLDPVAPGNGLINNNVRLGFLPSGQPLAVYHKRDGSGYQQIWAAAFDHAQWVSRQLTEWTYRWDFSGRGSLDFQIEIGRPTTTALGVLVDVRRDEEVQTISVTEGLSVKSSVDAAPWNALRRSRRSDGLYERVTQGRGWAPGDSEEGWFVVHSSVLDQRDQRPAGQAPTAQLLSVVGTSRLNQP